MIETHTQSVGLLWTWHQPVAVISTWQHSQQRDTRVAGGIWTRSGSKRAELDPHLRPRQQTV